MQRQVLCSAGVSADIDRALHLAAELTNEPLAKQDKLIIEYDPQPRSAGSTGTPPLDLMTLLFDQWIDQAFADHPDMINRLTGDLAARQP